eukprot:scaffold87396_cov50-Attheya_sp.AAC.2
MPRLRCCCFCSFFNSKQKRCLIAPRAFVGGWLPTDPALGRRADAISFPYQEPVGYPYVASTEGNDRMTSCFEVYGTTCTGNYRT